MAFVPTELVNGSTATLDVAVTEINGSPSTQPFDVYIDKIADFAYTAMTGSGWSIDITDSDFYILTYTPVVPSNGVTPTSRLTFQFDASATVGASNLNGILLNTGENQACSGANNVIARYSWAFSESEVQDLTPSIIMPADAFNVGETKPFDVCITEVLGAPTSAGTAAFNVKAPNGYSVAVVDASSWNMFVTSGTEIDFQAKPGVAIAANGTRCISLNLTNTTALANSLAQIVVNIYRDAAGTYDTNTLNNLASHTVTVNS